MSKGSYPLSKVYGLLEPGPVVLVTTRRKGKPNIPTAVEASEVKAPLVAECYASLECRVADTWLVNRYNFFVLQVVRAWVDTAVKNPQTLHHRGNGVFAVAGETVKLRSAMK
ncbi:flavin reductase [Thiobacillus sp.]|uniref:flavin reductase n=1 Tax=Thiobacillus sp. TaxID=924 RepID=UPI0017F5C519|nr:flavin reductase [Thiobacillus sp.]MBC2730891.1 hypothetical protein [Thiobacillus sp.]MBC2739628.1 flavin reductase [Thiobacillus sp.]MBC2760089.1 flavin reductase [Thiobacillus sp.]